LVLVVGGIRILSPSTDTLINTSMFSTPCHGGCPTWWRVKRGSNGCMTVSGEVVYESRRADKKDKKGQSRVAWIWFIGDRLFNGAVNCCSWSR
jgi:hypothetical protein